MGVLDDVLCNNDLFSKHKGETHHTQGLNPAFPGSTYEITPSGRLELLGHTYEDRSDPNAHGWKRFLGWMTPVFTGQRRDMDLHGWVEFPGFGRAKFTDGTMIAFETDSEQSTTVPVQERTDTPSVLSPNMEAPIYMQDEALGTLRVGGRKVEATCLRCRHFITDDWGLRKVLERFWAHQLLEHHVPPDLIGIEGLEYVGAAGIRLAAQIVVVSRPLS